jgi:hypothetical protein
MDRRDDRVVEARLRQLDQKRAELPIRNVLQGDREGTHPASYVDR